MLDDQELRDLWTALDTLEGSTGLFPGLCEELLLTAQRRGAVSAMAWDEIAGRDWVVPAARDKGKIEQVVPLTDAVIALLGERRTGFVFSNDGGRTPLRGLAKVSASSISGWPRSARRPAASHAALGVARSATDGAVLMSRAGVTADHAERVLGHAIPGVRSITTGTNSPTKNGTRSKGSPHWSSAFCTRTEPSCGFRNGASDDV